MPATTQRCPECDAEMTLRPLGPIEGEEHGLHMKIEGMPALQCPNGHMHFVAPTFPGDLLDRLLAAPPLVPLDGAAEKGFFRKHYCCPACGEALNREGSGRVEATRAVELAGLDRFGVEVDLPSFRCAACGHECVEPHETLVGDLMKASAHAFRSAHLAPG
jgi:hypothetical protein